MAQNNNNFQDAVSSFLHSLQTGAGNVYNAVPQFMQDSGFGSTLKAVAGNATPTQNKPAPANDMTKTLGYKLAGGTFGSADMAPAAAGEVASVASQTLPKIQKPGILSRIANKVDSNIGAARPQDIATNPRAPQEIGPMQESLSRHNVYSPNQAGPALDNIYNKYINPTMKANPKQISLESNGTQTGLIDNIVSEMRQREPNLDPREAKNVASKFINNLYDVARNNTEPSQVVPNAIDSGSLLKMKTNLNNTKALQQFFKDGTINSPEDLAAVSARNAMQHSLETAHPEITQLLRDYGNIKEAYPSMYQDSLKEAKISKNPLVAAGQITKPAVAGTLRKLDTPSGKAALGGLTGLGLYEAGKTSGGSPQMPRIGQGDNSQGGQLDTKNNQTQPQVEANGGTNESSQHAPSIPQSEEDIKPDAQGKYTVLDPFSLKGSDGTPLALSNADYAKQRAGIQNQLNDPSVKFNPVASQRVQSQLDNLDTLHQSTGDINQAYTAAKNLNNQFDDAESLLKQTKPNVFTSFNLPVVGAPLAGLRESTDANYSALVQKVKQLEQNAGLPAGSLYKPGQTSDVLRANLESARKKSLNQYYTIVNSVLGSAQQPVNPTNPNQMPSISGTNLAGNNSASMPTAGTNLPPIIKGLQVEPIHGATRVIQ